MNEPKIRTYRELTLEEIRLMNLIKAHEETVAALWHDLMTKMDPKTDGARQLAIARTEFEGAFMRMSRAVALPDAPWMKPRG